MHTVKHRLPFLSVFICVNLWPLFAAEDPAQRIAPELKTLVDVFTAVDSEGADPVAPGAAFYQGAIPGMLRTLDPHSIFFDPDQFRQLQEMQHSEQKGFGTIVNILPGRVIVLQTIQGSPSAKAGLSAGDEIVAINRVPLAFLDVEQLMELLGEARQQQVTLDVRRPGQERTEQISMSPQLLGSPTVDRAFLIAPGIAHLRITSFEQPTGPLVRETIEKLGGGKLKGLILDLRDNPGGAVQAAIETASLFLKPGQLIFSVKGRSTMSEDIAAPKQSVPYEFPMVVLVNSRSASASEIVTGALQDHDRAIVLGEPSYGKGLVQQVFPLSGESGLALTTAFYYTPSGRSIQKPLRGGQLGTATNVAKGPFRSDSGRLLQGGGGIQPDEVVYPSQQTRLQEVIDATGLLTIFAGEYLHSHDLPDDLQVTSAMLDQLQTFLAEHKIQPGPSDWVSHRAWIVSRLQQELLNLKFGVAKGDEIEMQRDPVIQRALTKLRVAP